MRVLVATFIVAVWMALAHGAPPELTVTPAEINNQGNVYSTGLVWRDCNNDGYLDMFLSNGNDIVQAANAIHIQRWGILPADATWLSSNTEYSGHCAVGDIDDDGYVDFLVSNYLGEGWGSPNPANLYMNRNGIPETTPSWNSAVEIFSFACALGDVDNDGDLDAAFATGEGYQNDYQRDQVYINDNGSLNTSPSWYSADSTTSMDVTWGDVDNDGDLDLALCGDDGFTRIHYNHGGALETAPSWQAADEGDGNTLIFGDIDGNGWLDLIVAYNNQTGPNGYFRAYFNDGAGTLNAVHDWQSNTEGYGSALALYDYDHDGDHDLAAGRWWHEVLVYENVGATLSSAPVWQSQYEFVSEEIAWVDIDGKGVLPFVDTVDIVPGRSLYYLSRSPVYDIDSVRADGIKLGPPGYCYDPISAWVSLAEAPAASLEIFYRYSFTNDLTVANWDTTCMAYYNNATPRVDFTAAPVEGWAPITVNFSDNTPDATTWTWHFGDGTTSQEQNPTHTYITGGLYDVSLEIETPEGSYTRTDRSLVRALADTLYFVDRAVSMPATVEIPIVLANTQPVTELIIPIAYAGDLTISYIGWNIDATRTVSPEIVQLIGYDPNNGRFVFRLAFDEKGQPLPPGRGAVLNLELYQYGTGVSTVDTTTASGNSLTFDSPISDYLPVVVSGHLYKGACGNLDGGTNGVVDVGDVTALILWLFLEGDQPAFPQQANVDGSPDGIVDVGDITWLIQYLFFDGPPPVCP